MGLLTTPCRHWLKFVMWPPNPEAPITSLRFSHQTPARKMVARFRRCYRALLEAIAAVSKARAVRMGVYGWESVAIVSRDVALTVFPSTAWLGGSLCDLCFLGGSFRTMGIYNRRCHLKTFCFFSSYHHLLTPRHSTQEVILEDHTLS